MAESWLEEIPLEECLGLLRANAVGRIGIIHDGLPIVLPVNYRMLENDGDVAMAIRTRPGNIIDRSGSHAALEIDGIDNAHRRGWSVLVRGTLRHAEAEGSEKWPLRGSDSWLSEEGDVWLVIEPDAISGRRLRTAAVEWAFLAQAYL